jgi:hypothetical protein
MSEDSSESYVFQYAGDDLFAVSHDVTGKNLPRAASKDWIFQHKLRIGEPGSVPLAVGYYIWRDACWSQRMIAGFHPAEPTAPPV